MAEQKIGTANIEIGVKSTVPQDLEASKKSLKDFASSTKQASQEVEKSMADASSAVAKMETSSDNLSRTQKRTADSIIRSAQRQSSESKAAYLDWVAAQAGVTNATQAARDKLRQWEAQQAESISAGRKYIQMLKEQTETLGMNRREMMQYQAAQLGVSDQAAPLIAKMFDTSKAYTAVEMSAKQTRQAMRMLPAQITDVVTSLASGMPMYLVAIQQGGQLRDSFGGFGNVLRGVAALISPAALAIGALATVGGTAYYAYEAFTGTLQSMNRTLIETGNFAGVTSDQMAAMARNVSANVGTQNEAAQALNAIVSSQALIGQSYEYIAQAAVAWSRATGASVDDVGKKFIALGEDPAEAMVKLNREMNFLTAAQYSQVDALIEQGDKTEASRILIEAMANTMNQRMPQMLEQTSIFARMWTTLKDGISDATTALGGFIDRMVSGGPLQDQYNTALAKYFEIANAIEQLQMNPAGVEEDIAFLTKQLDSQKELLAVLNQEIVVRGQQAMASKENAAAVEFEISLKKFLADGITAEAKVQQQLNAVIQEYLKLANDKNITDLQRITIEGALTEQVEKIWEGYLKQGKAAAGVTKATKDVNEEIRKSIANYEFETELIVMNNYEREKARFIRDMESKGIDENSVAWRENLDAFTAAQMARMNQQSFLDAIKREEKAAEEALKARLKAEEKFAKEVEKINDQIGQSLTDALMNGGMNAKEFLINMFKTMVLRPVLQPILTGFVGATGAGAALAGGMDQAGGIGGVGSFFGVGNAIKSAYSMVSSGFSTIGASVSESLLRAGDFLATSSSDFLAAGGEFLQSISQSAGTFATAAAGISAGFAVGNLISGDKSVIGGNPMFTTGGGAALGAAIGSIVPGIGTAIGGAIGGIVGGIVNAAFGSGKKEYTDSGIRGQLNAMGADLQEYQKWKKSGGWFSSTKRGTEFNDISAELKAGLDQTLGNISLSVALFAASLNQPVDAITSFSKQIDVSFKDLSEQEITAAIEGELKAFESGLIEAVIPTIRQFSMANEEVGATLQRLSNSMAVFNQTIDMLGFKMFDVSLIAADMASSVINMFGGQENFVAATSAYYDKFYTAQEKINYQTEQLTSVFDALNLALPDTHQQFRALVDAAQMAGDYKTFSTLVQLAPAFDALQTAMAELGNTAIRTATDIANEREKLETQLMQAIGNTAGLRQRELDALDPSNRALQQQIWAIEDARKAIDDAMATLSKSVEAERKQALERLQTENKAVMESLEAQKNASQIAADVSRNSVKTLQSLFDYIGSQVEQINREVGASRIAASGMEFISRALETAQRTGYLPNQNELASAITAARSGLGSENFSTSFEMRRANLQVAGQLTLLGEITGEQLTTAEKQLAAQEKMIEGINLQIQQAQEFYQAEVERTNTYYDKILEDVKAQIDALNGINTSVISVKDAVKGVETAISGLASAMMSAQSAQAAPMAGASSGAISRPQSGYRLVGNTLYFPGGGTHTVSGANGAQTLIQTYGLTQTSSGLVRTRAMGGYTPPGMTLVGEEGPELVNFRSPAMVYSNSQSKNLIGGEIATEIKQLREENRAQSRAMVEMQMRMTRLLERWDGDGLPEERMVEA